MPAENFPLQTAALVPVRIREGIRHNLVLLMSDMKAFLCFRPF